MKTFKKVMLVLLTVAMLITNTNIQVFAQDEESKQTYTVKYQFVLEGQEDMLPEELEAIPEEEREVLPDEVMELLPEDIENLSTGDTVVNVPIDKEVEVDGYVYKFVEWKMEECKIEDEDITVIGVWSKVEKEEAIDNDLTNNETGNEVDNTTTPETPEDETTLEEPKDEEVEEPKEELEKTEETEETEKTEELEKTEETEEEEKTEEEAPKLVAPLAPAQMLGNSLMLKAPALKGTAPVNYFTFRWDDFGKCSGWFEGSDKAFYPSLYFADRKIVFCIESSVAYPAYVEEFTYNTSTIDSFWMYDMATKQKIVRIAQYVIEDIGTNSFDVIKNDMTMVGKCLAAQYAIWRVCYDGGYGYPMFHPNTEGSYVNEVAMQYYDFYYTTVANQQSNAGINIEQASYKGFVDDVIKVGKVTNPSKVTVTLPSGIVFCDQNGNNTSSPVWSNGYFYIKATTGVENATVTVKTNNQFAEALFLDSTEGQNVVMAGSLPAESKSFTVTAEQFTVSVKKVASETDYNYLQNCPNNYTLAGAVYGIFSDMECTNQLGTVTTTANGNSNQFALKNVGVYYVKEIKASQGFKLNPEIIRAEVSNTNRQVTVTSVEEPINDPIRIVLTKQNARDNSKAKYLDEAEFTLRYYDTQADDVSGLTPLYTWVFKPVIDENGNAVVKFESEESFVSGDERLIDENGEAYLPLGTFTIQETKAPRTYQIDPNIYVGHIVEEDGKTVVLMKDGEFLTIENLSLTQSEREVIVETVATWKENAEHYFYDKDGNATPIDKVVYDFLMPGVSYTLKAKLVNKETEEVFLETEKEFTPESESGDVIVEYETIDPSKLGGTTYVSYEYLYLTEDFEQIKTICANESQTGGEGGETGGNTGTGDNTGTGENTGNPNNATGGCSFEFGSPENDPYIIAKHEDLEDEAQTISIDKKPEVIKTVVSNKDIHINEDNTIVEFYDTVVYENLRTDKVYMMKATLINKATGKEVVINKVKVEGTLVFIPTEENGSVNVPYSFNAVIDENNWLNDGTYVAFEELYEVTLKDENGKLDISNVDTSKLMSEHKDINDPDQTLKFTDDYRLHRFAKKATKYYYTLPVTGLGE